jgi:hypothetical protein
MGAQVAKNFSASGFCGSMFSQLVSAAKTPLGHKKMYELYLMV